MSTSLYFKECISSLTIWIDSISTGHHGTWHEPDRGPVALRHPLEVNKLSPKGPSLVGWHLLKRIQSVYHAWSMATTTYLHLYNNPRRIWMFGKELNVSRNRWIDRNTWSHVMSWSSRWNVHQQSFLPGIVGPKKKNLYIGNVGCFHEVW